MDEPLTRKEMYLAKIGGENVSVPEPLTREEMYLNEIVERLGNPTPTGKKNITDTTETDVSAYATAQVVDANLVAENIKKDVVVLGITGTYEGGGGSSDFSTATITLNLTPPQGVTIDSEGIDNARIEYPSDNFSYASFIPAVNHVASILMYQGKATFIAVVGESPTDDYELDNETATLSGDIEYNDEDECYVVTGDCAITGTMVAIQ